MQVRLLLVIFVILCLANVGEGIYLWRLWQELQQAEETLILLRPLAAKEEDQRKEIEELVKKGSNVAVDRLVQYGKATQKKAVAFAAITSLKRMNSAYADQRLGELLQDDTSKFTQDMALAAYRMYGSKEDVKALQSLLAGTKLGSLKEKLAKLVEFLKNRSKEEADKAKVFTFIEKKPKGREGK